MRRITRTIILGIGAILVFLCSSGLLAQTQSKDVKVWIGPSTIHTGRGSTTGMPTLKKMVRPAYPPKARKDNIEGMLQVTVLVGKDGKVLRLRVQEGQGILVEAAKEAISQWEYEPFLFEGEAIEVETTITVVFQLQPDAQDPQEANPRAALTAALVAACRQNDQTFARYLTVESAEAFRALPDDQRKSVMGRFVLLGEPGRPLLSDDAQGRTVLRCETPSLTGEMRIGNARTRENLAFIPVEAVGARTTEFGMVREGGGWRILSLGLLLVNIAELARQWAVQELQMREEEAIRLLQYLADRIRTYREAFGRLPEGLAQLGPPPANEGVSPDAAKLVDEELAAGAKSGYRFRYRIVPAAPEGGGPTFELAAAPAEYGKTGKRSFFLDANGRLRGADKQGAVATAADPILEVSKRFTEPKP